jgi:hypothetical protein
MKLCDNGMISEIRHTFAYSEAISLPLYASKTVLTSGVSKIAMAIVWSVISSTYSAAGSSKYVHSKKGIRPASPRSPSPWSPLPLVPAFHFGKTMTFSGCSAYLSEWLSLYQVHGFNDVPIKLGVDSNYFREIPIEIAQVFDNLPLMSASALAIEVVNDMGVEWVQLFDNGNGSLRCLGGENDDFIELGEISEEIFDAGTLGRAPTVLSLR